MLSEAVASEAGKVLLPYVLEKVADENNSTIKNTQAGTAGAVPLPDSAPLTGAPKADSVGKPDNLQYVDDRNAQLFDQHNTSSMADLANAATFETGHATNGNHFGS